MAEHGCDFEEQKDGEKEGERNRCRRRRSKFNSVNKFIFSF